MSGSATVQEINWGQLADEAKTALGSFASYKTERERLRDLEVAVESRMIQAVDAYMKRREELFKKLMAEKKLIWCPVGLHMVLPQKLSQFSVSGTRSRGSCEYAYDEDFIEVWTACADCSERVMANHGSCMIHKLSTTATECEVPIHHQEKFMREWGLPPAIVLSYSFGSTSLKVIGYKDLLF